MFRANIITSYRMGFESQLSLGNFLARHFEGVSVLTHVSTFSFLLWDNFPLYGYGVFCLFLHWLMGISTFGYYGLAMRHFLKWLV